MAAFFVYLSLVGSLLLQLAAGQTVNSYGSLPKFLTNNPTPHGYPWGTATATNTNPETGAPDTGVTRSYNFTISKGNISPDGVTKDGILINNQFPGPLIEANWGDTIQVTVVNDIPNEGTTLHWHGQTQRLSPSYDGVPAVQQCPIAPGSSYTYTFRAEVYGTSWYHSHVSAQYMDGVYGPMVIYGPRSESYDEDLGPVMLTEYYDTPYYQYLVDSFLSPPIFLESNTNLINGKMDSNCAPGASNSTPCNVNNLAQFKFQPGKTYLLRLINPGVTMTQKFSIDGYELTVIANDYVAVNPYTTNTVTLGVGQRTDVLVKATGSPGDLVWMRSDVDTICYANTSSQPHALGLITYPGAAADTEPTTTATPWQSNNCQNDDLSQTVPQYARQPPSQPATTITMEITGQVNGSGILLWNVNNSSFRGDYNYPVFLLAKTGNDSYPLDPEWNVYNLGTNTSVRVILYNTFPLAHPMHLHGHNMWVLAEGLGEWDGTVTNPSNPLRRDVHLMQPGTEATPSYLVLEWNADNPGVWPLHCHIIGHVSLGLYANMMERPDLIPSQPVDQSAADNCKSWWTWSEHDFVDQIDSGL